MTECAQAQENSTPVAGTISPSIIVEGGAYRTMPGYLKEIYETKTKESAKAGYAILMQGGTAVDAVEAAVRLLENDEHFNAGFGSLLNNDGEVECDAMIMEGHTLESGAVISGRHFRNPVSLAKQIMKKSDHCALSGDGALDFALEQKFPVCAPKQLISEEAKLKMKTGCLSYMEYVKYFYEGKPTEETQDTVSDVAMDCNDQFECAVSTGTKDTQDTVSAVAMDCNGQFACALSTGGVAMKSKGRVGDAPMVGCGGYANKTGAATVTGFGEAIIKVTLAREVVFNMEKGQDAQKSVENGLKKMEELVRGYGGAIAIDKHGNFGKHFTTNMMVWASIKDNNLESGIEKGKVEREPAENIE